MNLPSELIAAYQAAIYQVYAPDGTRFELKIEQPCESLDAWLSKTGYPLAHVITADNPRSAKHAGRDNQLARAKLRARLDQLMAPYLSSRHIDPLKHWPMEQGFCIAGLEHSQACKLAREFRQNAFLAHHIGKTTELVLTER